MPWERDRTGGLWSRARCLGADEGVLETCSEVEGWRGKQLMFDRRAVEV